jgi:hypothetical protein
MKIMPIKKNFLTLVVLTLFVNACAAPREIHEEVPPIPTLVGPQVNQDTLLFGGPDNRSFPVLSTLNVGKTLVPLGIFQDFVKVDVSGQRTGFMHKDLIDNLPNDVPEIPIQNVPWIPVNISDYFQSEITTFTDNVIILENTEDVGFGWEAGSASFDSPFRIKMSLGVKNPQAGQANIQLIGTPHNSHAEDWWQGLISMELSINSDGLLRFCIRDGSSEDCAYNETSTIQNGQLFMILFDDPQGKTFHLIDDQGTTVSTVKTNDLTGLNLPNGLFPDKNFWLGAWINKGVSLTVSSFALEKEPDGKWDFNVDSAVYSPVSPEIITEEKFIDFVPSKNGTTPLWNRGTSVIVRQDDNVFISMIETHPEWAQPNNVNCGLYQRTLDGWQVQVELNDPTREPCPIASDGGDLYISTNRSLGENSLPEIAIVNEFNFGNEPVILTPEWTEGHNFTAWSYRGISMDANNKELLLLNISDDYGYYWTFLDKEGQWSSKGVMNFPIQEDGTNLRLAYPNTILQNHSAYIMTVSDVLEPNYEYIGHMPDHGTDFHYVFRQLYYSWTPDITSQDLSEWKLLASVEPYGEISNQDIWMAKDGITHFLWVEKSVDSRLENHLPEVLDTQTLWHAVLKDGGVISRTRLMTYDTRGIRPNRASFHSLPNGRLFVIISVYEITGETGNHLIELYADRTHSSPIKLGLKEPLGVFQIAGQQNGSPPSNYIDIIGTTKWDSTTLNYVRIKLEQP